MNLLDDILAGFGKVAVAVSGGVDSMTLAHAAHRTLGRGACMVHAVSPAVPPEATRRVQAHAGREGWNLRVIDAGEFANPDYVANPADRCFHCKSALYDAILAVWDGTIASGTNKDDLGDYRPGLEAAARRSVRHPFVEAGMDKAAVRALASAFGLHDLAELPATPCLASRIETGIPIAPATLERVLGIEDRVNAWLADKGVRTEAVRCRVRAEGMVVELDPAGLAAVDETLARDLGVRFAPYRRGSAFLTGPKP